MPLSNVPTQVPLRHRGKGAACRSALVRLLPGVTLVVGAQGLLPRRSIRAARPRARVRLLPRVIAVVGVQEGLIGRMDRGRQLAARFGRGLVKAKANVALDASVQFSCAHVHTLQFVVAGRSTELENVFQLCGAGIKSTGARYGGGARCSSRPRTRRRRTSVIIAGCRR